MLSTSMEIRSAPTEAPDLETLFRDHNRMVYRTAYRLTGNSADAEDVLQTVFLRLSSRDLLAKPVDHAESYLRRAAVNASLDLIRQRRAAGSHSEALVDQQVAPPGDVPEHRLQMQQRVEWLRGAVGELSQQAAEIFALRFFEERSNAEIAGIVGSSTNTVAVTLHRSRERLKDQFRQYLGGNHE
ncbi:MAG: sigma-70 family RNA polymerase sigma factor [Bryobacterales bacterium]|nr:sigma-70 family RNA polymerase sigma factor [Bryobacterales bacterium]